MNSKRKTFITITLASLALGVIVGFFAGHQNHQEKLIRNLEARIKTELSAQHLPYIETLVRQEVQRIYQDTFAKAASPDLLLSQTDEPLVPELQMEKTVRRIIEHIYESPVPSLYETVQVASDNMLDQYVAGAGISPDTVIQGGHIKTPRVQSDLDLARITGGGSVASADDASLAEEIDGEKAPRPQAIDRTLQQKGSVLLGKGKWTFEPSFTYAHFSTNRINIQGVTILEILTIGPVSTEKIQRDIFIQTMGFKYGLKDNLQADLRIPARFEFDRTSSTDQTSEDTRSKGGLGDISLSLSRQIGWEEGWKPDVIASVGIKSNTGEPIYNNEIALGTGHWTINGALVAAKSSDPAVVFGSLGYAHSFKEDFENYGTVAPGDTYSYSLGTAIALSYQTAINFSFDQSFTQKLKRGGEAVVGSFVNSANFKAGLNWALSERSSVDLSVAMGLTSDSPDMTVEIRFPYYF